MLRTVVRGHAFAARPLGAAMPKAGRRLQLVREHENPLDPWAVAVWHDDSRHLWRLGYLDRAVAARIGPRIDRGMTVQAAFDGWVAEPGGRWQRPMITIDRQALVSGTDPIEVNGTARVHDAQLSVVPSADGLREPDSPSVETYRQGEPAVSGPQLAAERPPRLWGRPPGTTRRVARFDGVR